MVSGARSRAAGQTFEDMIAASLVWHEERGILKAAKTPEPMKPIGPKRAGGRFLAVYTKAAQVDFSGTMRGGRSVRFEAKQTDTDRFERKRLTDEQMADLRGHDRLGALCFVVCCFGADRFYRVPWRDWDGMKAVFGRQYVTEEDLRQYRIPYTAGVIKLMAGIVRPEAGGLTYVPDICVACGEYAGEGSQLCPACREKARGEGPSESEERSQK